MNTTEICAHADRKNPYEHILNLLKTPQSIGDWVEIDVQRTSDGHYIMWHDYLCGIKPAEKQTLNELKSQNIFTLKQGLDLLQQHNLKPHIDAKCTYTDQLALYVRKQTESEFLITVTDPREIQKLAALKTQQKIKMKTGLSLPAIALKPGLISRAATYSSQLMYAAKLPESKADFLAVHHLPAKLWVLKAAERKNIPVMVWTLDTEKEIQYMLNHNQVWAIVTNTPEAACELKQAEELTQINPGPLLNPT